MTSLHPQTWTHWFAFFRAHLGVVHVWKSHHHVTTFEQPLKGWKHPRKWGKGHRKYDFQTPSLMCREYLTVVLMSFRAFCTYLPLEKWFPSLDIGFKIFNYHLGVGERSPESPRVKSVGFTFPDGLNCIFQKLGRSQNTTKMLPSQQDHCVMS